MDSVASHFNTEDFVDSTEIHVSGNDALGITPAQGKRLLSDLPLELLHLIGEFVTTKDFISLYATNKRFYHVLKPHLYSHDAKNGCSALHWAIKKTNYDIAQKSVNGLQASGMVDTYGSKALLLAAKQGDQEILDMLLKAEVKLDALDSFGMMPLHVAAVEGDEKAVNLLLMAGADVNAQGAAMWTPMHFAAVRGHEAVVNRLLMAGANVEAQENFGHTPAHLASLLHPDLVRLLQISNS